MGGGKSQPTQRAAFEIGSYVCPNRKSLVTLTNDRPRREVQWPVVVDPCSACGERHVLESQEVSHPPFYGHE